MFIGALFTVVKIWKQSNSSTVAEWIKKIYIYTYTMDYYLAIKKE